MQVVITTSIVLQALISQFGENNVEVVLTNDDENFNTVNLTEEQMKFVESEFTESQIDNPDMEALIEEAFSQEDVTQFEDVADMLGFNYSDKISGLVGVVVMVGQDIQGVVQALLQPKCRKDNILPERQWVSIDNLTKV